MALDFSGIPDHAERKDGVSVVTSDRGNPFPWTVPLRFDGESVIAQYLVGEIDITEQYNAWVASQPQVHSVTFTWTEPPLDQETEDA